MYSLLQMKKITSFKKTDDNYVNVNARRTKHDGGRKQIAIGTGQIR